MSKRTIITIGRQNGSGGREIGMKVAERLGIPYYDKELLKRTAQESELSEDFIKEHDEKKSSSLLYSIAMDSTYMGNSGYIPSNDKVFLAQFNAIKKIAEEGSCVIIGRCADYALEEDPDLLSVFIYADYDFRVGRVMKEEEISESKARIFINRTDKKRASYYDYYTGKKWASMSTYDISLNSGKFGIDKCVDMLCEIVK